jgi:hypothetical protein
MRILLAGAAMALLVAGSAYAQTEETSAGTASASTCGELPARPTLPDGANANREQMDAANTAYTAWSQTYHANLTCRRTEADNARATWQARVAEYNAAATGLNESNTSWEAEVAEYNARGNTDAPSAAGTRRPRQSN